MNRKSLFRASALALVLCTALSVSAATKVGVLLKGKSAFWSAVENGAKAAGEKAGAEVIVKAPLNETDVAVQVQLFNALVAQGAQAIVIAPINKDALSAPAAAAVAKGVKIVVIDSPLAGDAGGVFVGTDQRAAGEAAGTLLASLVTDKDEVSFFKHNQNGGATEQREVGALAKLKEGHPAVVVYSDVYASTEAGVEAERAQFLLEKHPGTKAILASGTPGTMAMLKTLEDKKSNGAIKFVGFGFNLNPAVAAAIDSGTMQGWVAQLPGEVGGKGVESALALVAGQTVPPVVHTDFVVITKSNLKDAKIQALLN